MVEIKGIKYSITSQPFITGDASITIEIIQQKYFLNGMSKSCASLNFSFLVGNSKELRLLDLYV